MDIGFIGAGKAGFSMGKYLTERKINVTGYYSKTPLSSVQAAKFTGTRQYLSIEELVRDSEVIFITVPDGQIASVWEEVKSLNIQGKKICHFSGSLTSAIFEGISDADASGYSVHPLFAINSKYESYKDFPKAHFTVEGDPAHLGEITGLLEGLGNPVTVISSEDKARYHAAAAMASNLYVGLCDLCERMLTDCGFTRENAHKALAPLILGNTENIVKSGPEGALTGPIERNDISTVKKHLECLSKEEKEVYICLSGQVIKVAQGRHPERDYAQMKGVLRK